MLKLFKTVIRPNEGAETYARDSKHRVTMGYNDETKTISVKVDEVIAPNPDLSDDLPENTSTVLRDPHTTADYQQIVTREFTAADFLMKTDNNKWIVEYDAKSKTISDPIDVYEISKQYINGSNSHEKIYRNLNEYRYQYNDNLTPLFVVDSFFKSLGFDGSTLQFFVEDLQIDFLDTILEISPDQVTEVNNKEYEFWCNYNVRIPVSFEIVDETGKVMSSAYPSVKADRKTVGFVPLEQKSPVDLTGINPELNIQTGSFSGNRYYVKMPAADTFNVRIMFGSRIHNLINKRPFVTFDVDGVNCIINKTRVTNEYNPAQPNVYVQEFLENHNHPADKMAQGFGGADGVLIRTAGLLSGDYFKLKLNLGEFISWAELWVEIA